MIATFACKCFQKVICVLFNDNSRFSCTAGPVLVQQWSPGVFTDFEVIPEYIERLANQSSNSALFSDFGRFAIPAIPGKSGDSASGRSLTMF
jgi:hypothetical protein